MGDAPEAEQGAPMSAPAAGQAAPVPVRIEAQEIRWVSGRAEASGGVVIRWGEERVEGERAIWDGDQIEVFQGRYLRPEGTLAFERAEIRLTAGGETRGWLEGVAAEVGTARLAAAALQVEEGRWSGQRVVLQPCRCADGGRAAVDFSAAAVEVVAGGPDGSMEQGVAVLRGAAMRVFSLPVVPLPWARVSLDPDRFRVLFPEVGHGEPGWSASVEGRGGVEAAAIGGRWTAQGGPAWREDRGLRLGLLIAGPEAAWTGGVQPELRAEGAYDTLDTAWRGALSGSGASLLWPGGLPEGVHRPEVAWGGELLSADYAEDFSVSWVQRGVEWREVAGRFGAGGRAGGAGLAGEAALWRPEDGSVGRVAELRLSGLAGRGASVRPSASLALVDGAPVGIGAVTAEAERTAGGWHGAAAAAGEGWIGARQERLSARAQSDLSFWGEAPGGARALWWPGVRLAGSWSADSAGWGAGPGLDVRVVKGAGVLSASGALLYGAAEGVRGWRPELRAALWMGSWQGSAEASWAVFGAEEGAEEGAGAIQAARLLYAPGAGGAGLWLSRSAGTTLIGADVTIHPGRLVAGGGVSRSLEAGEWAGAGLRLGYDDGCSSLLVSGNFSPDRTLPDVSAQLIIRK